MSYLFSSESNDYFNRAKEEFGKIEIKDESLIKKDWIDSYKLVLSSKDYGKFILEYYDNQISRLTKQNNVLKRQNKELELENQKILSSNSWKITRPLRNLKKFN